MATPENTIILPTVHGQMLVNRYDLNQTLHYFQRCAAIDNEEIDSIVPLVLPGMAAIDVGTCFGAWTLEFSKRATMVYSFEAQRYLCNCLAGTLALNSIENVYVFNMAVGDQNGAINVPRYDLGKPLQFGCVYLCPRKEHGENEQQPKGSEPVQLVTLDSFGFQNISFIKIDVEGMELEVLKGAEKTISENRPVLYVEFRLSDRKAIEEFLVKNNYVSTNNAINLLALPAEKFTVERMESGATRITHLKR